MASTIKNWGRKHAPTFRWIGWYSLLFTLASVAAFWVMWAQGDSFLRQADAIAQHYPALYQYNLILRGLIQHPSAGIDLWTYNAGLGGDTLTTFSYYVLGDPFAPLSLLFPMKSLGLAYNFLYLVRLYAAGMAALFFFRKIGARLRGALPGSIIYAFAAFALHLGQCHPFFVVAMVMLPLLFIGIERALFERKYGFLIVTTFITAAWNYYFFYVLTIFTILYALFRYLEKTPKGERLRGLPGAILKLGGAYLIGVLMAAIVLLPNLYAVISSTRLGVDKGVHPFYTLNEYLGMFQTLFTFRRGVNSTLGGIALSAFMLVPVYFMRKKGLTALKALFLLTLVFIAVPYIGYVFNVFLFTSNRFSFTLALFVAAMVALVLSDSERYTKRELIGVFAVFAVVVIASIPGRLYPVKDPLFKVAVWIELLLALLFGLYLLFVAVKGGRTKFRLLHANGIPFVFTAFMLGFLAINGPMAMRLHIWQEPYKIEPTMGYNVYHTKEGEAVSRITDDGSMGTIDDATDGAAEPFYRVDRRVLSRDKDSLIDLGPSNDPIVLHYNGIASYFSMTNGFVQNYMTELNNRLVWSTVSYKGFDNRAELLNLVGARYYLSEDDSTEYVPYGFEFQGRIGKIRVYKNTEELPFGFVYEDQVDRGEYDKLSDLEKQESLLQAAVVDTKAGESAEQEVAAVPTITPDTSDVTTRPWKVVALDNAEFDEENHTISILTKAGGSVTLEITEEFADSELYLRLTGVDYVKTTKTYKPAKQQPSLFPMRLSVDGGEEKSQVWVDEEANYYWGNNTQLTNLGYREDGAKTITLSFEDRETLTYDSLDVLTVSMQDYDSRIERLASNPMENTRLEANRITGTTDSPQEGILYLSIPYSVGWSVKIDGEEAPLLRVNTGFIGTVVPAGSHNIEFSYMTPWLPEGAIVSGVGVVLCGCVVYFEKGRRRKTELEKPQPSS